MLNSSLRQAALAQPKTIKVHREGITGRFVTAEYAAAHPATTMRQTVNAPSRKQKDTLNEVPPNGPADSGTL